ncbi:hypothetical protein LDL36_11270 [Komagataeibacter sp. FNDCR1]|nr:hypothetical protein [Komagataeibacter sp. FNDCR1]
MAGADIVTHISAVGGRHNRTVGNDPHIVPDMSPCWRHFFPVAALVPSVRAAQHA